ncbi:Aste57867_489 [Aphanomyces stellatus]|uniref:Aste57867_489 protein n=1 Tax=Aphanomyces stellatus TaxID=120398 RepID=A0A485K6V6_9STRA|nr:hypothetical protein As57867_000488 [Aphanomyces stellatus]VFT77714.1 Aste57867_489 [Aphanomyces stellatus]
MAGPPPPQAILLDKFNQMIAFRSVAAFGSLGIADHLAAGPATAVDIAQALHLHPQSTFRLLRAGANIGLVTQSSPCFDDAVFALTPLGDCLRSDVPGSLRHLMQAWATPGFWQSFQYFEATIQTGQTAAHIAHGTDIWTYFAKHPEDETMFAKGLDGLSDGAIQAFLAAYEFDQARTRVVVDVGGSHGSLLAATMSKLPAAQGILFDVPAVINTANAKLTSYGALKNRITAISGDFFQAVPQSGDLYMLKYILHDWNDAECVLILKNIVKAASRGAKVLAIEMVLHSNVEPAAATPGGLLSPSIFMDMSMLVLCTGQERTPEQYAALYKQAGIQFTRYIPTASPFGIIEGVVE